jgi:hypothetical protein
MTILPLKVSLLVGENVISKVALAPLFKVSGRTGALPVNGCVSCMPVMNVGRELVFVTTSGWVWLLLTATPLKTRFEGPGLSVQEFLYCPLPMPVRRSVKVMRSRINAIAFCLGGLVFPTLHPFQRLLRCLRGLG